MSDQRLIAVEIVVSGVIPAPLDAVWERVSNFTDMGDWLAPMHGERVRTSHMVRGPLALLHAPCRPREVLL